MTEVENERGSDVMCRDEIAQGKYRSVRWGLGGRT